MTAGAAAHFDALRAEVEAALQAALPAPPDCPPGLAEAMRYSLLAGGKRLRPLLCLTACEAVGGHRTHAMAAACALEYIHTYSLIHDDLPAMDDDTMRRGRPTLHVVSGEGLAILAGDGLLTEAFGLLSRVPGNTTTAAQAIRVIGVIASAAGVGGMVGGQAIDLGSAGAGTSETGRQTFDMAAVQSMHARKTGALIRASAVAGAIMGGGADEAVACIDRAAAEFGLAFQIVDDILDVEGSSSELGKTAGKDAVAGKPTYPAVFGLDRSRQEAAQCLVRAREALASAGLESTHLLALGQSMVQRSR